MKVRTVLLSCVLGLLLAIGAFAQRGRGAVCGDGDEFTRYGAEEEARQNARTACSWLNGTLTNVQIIASNCSFYDLSCRATACGNCVPY